MLYGEAVDFWRVTAVEPGRRLALPAEMKLPGDAMLEFVVEPGGAANEAGTSRLVQTATFRPRGLAGLLYWYGVMPLHGFVFNGMLRGIQRTAEREAIAKEAASPRT